jgi:hypothetical protein
MKDESVYYSSNFWYNEINSHNYNQDVHEYGKDYYVYKIYNDVIKQIKDVPSEGHIVVLGTNRCVSFDLLCQHFGYERCIGFDIDNPTNHPRVKIMDCSQLNDEHNIPISFVHNDLGSFPLTPKLKLYAQLWAAKNVVNGGFFLSRNNLNSAKYDLENIMIESGFINTQFESLKSFIDLKNLDFKTIEGHMISTKMDRVLY